MASNVYSSLTMLYRPLDESPITHFPVRRVQARRRDGHEDFDVDSPPSAASCRHLRKAQPSSEPLPGTFNWIARLPRNVRPLQLLREFPRVTNTLAASWHDPLAFRACLYDLLVDKRGNRRGFPDQVFSELLALRAYFENSCL
jgi:hypothetical protein